MKRVNLESMIHDFMFNDRKCFNCLNPKMLHYMTYDDEYGRWRLTCPSSMYIDGWRTFYADS